MYKLPLLRQPRISSHLTHNIEHLPPDLAVEVVASNLCLITVSWFPRLGMTSLEARHVGKEFPL